MSRCTWQYALLSGQSVVSDSAPHGLQHSRHPCPSPSPGICSNSCPLSHWCHSTTSSSVAPFSSCPQFPPANMWVVSKYLLTLISNVIPSGKRTDSVWCQHLYTTRFWHLVLCARMYSSVSWFTVYGNLNRICTLLLCENYVNLNYVELVHSALRIYSFYFFVYSFY